MPSTHHALILLGFMGAGKSSVGAAVAAKLGWQFEDLDLRIEHREGRPIAALFSELGESGFRKAETLALTELLQSVSDGTKMVIALGGGAFVQDANQRLIAFSNILTVSLDAEVEELWRRCRLQAGNEGVLRPLLAELSDFRKLHSDRREHYMRAKLHLATDGKSVEEIAHELADFVLAAPAETFTTATGE